MIEEELKAQISELKKEKEETELAVETANAKLNQRDTQIKRLLTENAGYLQDIDESQQTLKNL